MLPFIGKIWQKYKQRKALERFVIRLIALNELEIGMVAMNAALARNMLEKNAQGLGFVPGASMLYPHEFVESAPDHLARFEFMFKEVSAKQQLAFAAGLTPWLHTLRAAANPGLAELVKVMWQEISKGFEQVPALAQSANMDMSNIDGFFRIPEGFGK